MRSLMAASVFLLALAPLSAQAASLSFDPSGGSYGPGDTFIAAVRIDPQGQCINAAQVAISYPPDELRVVDVGQGSSIFSLWVENPQVDAQHGTITFSGGIPGGYCGVISGDPGESNVLADVVFTVLKTDAKTTSVSFLPATSVYLNDGHGTQAKLSTTGATYTLLPTPVLSSNEWLQELKGDTTPPDPFTVQVESTDGVFGGAYYAVFSTVDKQSGIDHYAILENGVWKTITSPYKLPDQSLRGGVEIKAVDKAGNERIGTYNASSTPPRALKDDVINGIVSLLALILLICLLAVSRRFWKTGSGAGSSASEP